MTSMRRNLPHRPHGKEARLSVRLVWPLIRAVELDAGDTEILARAGVTAAELVNPDTRISRDLALELVESIVARTGYTDLGLRAGQRIEPGDLDVLEYAVRNSPNVREALRCMCRYVRLADDTAELTLTEDGDYAMLRHRNIRGASRHAAFNDFVLSAIVTSARRYLMGDGHPVAVNFMHDRPAHADEYARIFGPAVGFGTPHNEIVIPRSWLELRLSGASPVLHEIFRAQADALLPRLQSNREVSDRVARLIVAGLNGGGLGLRAVAEQLTMSIPTLRRHLAQEGTSHKRLTDEIRADLAKHWLADAAVAIGEIAFLLGYSDVAAFHKAFKRWTGSTPAGYRERVKRGRA